MGFWHEVGSSNCANGRFCGGEPLEVAASANEFKEPFNVLADESIMVNLSWCANVYGHKSDEVCQRATTQLTVRAQVGDGMNVAPTLR